MGPLDIPLLTLTHTRNPRVDTVPAQVHKERETRGRKVWPDRCAPEGPGAPMSRPLRAVQRLRHARRLTRPLRLARLFRVGRTVSPGGDPVAHKRGTSVPGPRLKQSRFFELP
jgi:hypothetical protein